MKKGGKERGAAPNEFIEHLRNQEHGLVAAAEELAWLVSGLESDERYAPAKPRALIVGGYVRDVLLGGKPKDADIEVYGVDPEELESLLADKFGSENIDLVGKAFGIIKVHIGPGLELDVSIPRKESKQGKGHKGIVTHGDPSMSVLEAARRRDFSVNALAMDPITGEVFDPFHGKSDLERRILRATDNERFQDDPLRVMRAVQFAARLDFTVEPGTRSLLKRMVAEGQLDELPRERMTTEWEKLVKKSERPSIGLELMRELGITERYYPELHALIDTQQDAEWHPEGDVWVHTMMVVDWAAKIAKREGLSEKDTLKLVLGAIGHDFGKPSTTKFEDGHIRSRGHEEAGAEPVTKFFERFSFGTEIRDAAVLIATQHLKPNSFMREFHKWREKDGETKAELTYANIVRALIKRLQPMSWKLLVAASEADSRGRTIPGCETNPYEPGLLMARIVEKYQLEKEAKKPLLQGPDLFALGVKTGKGLGDLIRYVETLRDGGMVETREQALAAVRESGLYAMIMLEQSRTKKR